MSFSRPLRWPKFVILLFFASVSLAKALPSIRAAAILVRQPYIDHAAPLFLPLLVGTFACLALLGIAADAALDRLMPKWSIILLGIVAICPWQGSDADAALGRFPSLHRAAFSLRNDVMEELRDGGSGNRAVQKWNLASHPSSFRSRTLQRLPVEVKFVADHFGPVVRPLAGDPPGTIYLSVAKGGRAGWITAVVLEDSEPAILRDGGKVWILPFFDADSVQGIHGEEAHAAR